MTPDSRQRPAELMALEMLEQPGALQGLLDRRAEFVQLVKGVAPSEIRGVALVARGSSDNAAIVGRYAIEMLTRLPTTLIAPSIATQYEGTFERFQNFLLVALSQSGRTPEVVTISERFRAAGLPVLAICNDVESPLADISDAVLGISVGAERAVPATKTVTGQMLATVLVAEALATATGALSDQDALATLPQSVAQLLGDTRPTDEAAMQLAAADRLAIIGRGPAYAAALESALKVQETCGVLAHGFSAADYRHGPIVTAGAGAVPVLLGGGGDLFDLSELFQARSQPYVTLGPVPGPQETGQQARMQALRNAIEATVIGQQLALSLCRNRGIDPDRPPFLSKVTATY